MCPCQIFTSSTSASQERSSCVCWSLSSFHSSFRAWSQVTWKWFVVVCHSKYCNGWQISSLKHYHLSVKMETTIRLFNIGAQFSYRVGAIMLTVISEHGQSSRNCGLSINPLIIHPFGKKTWRHHIHLWMTKQFRK